MNIPFDNTYFILDLVTQHDQFGITNSSTNDTIVAKLFGRKKSSNELNFIKNFLNWPKVIKNNIF